MRSCTGNPAVCICSTSDWSESSPGCGPIASSSSSERRIPSRRRNSTRALAPARLDRAEDVDHALRVAYEMWSCLRLHDDDADAVCDHVVELARDPSALVGDCPLRLLLALAFELRRALLEVGDALA